MNQTISNLIAQSISEIRASKLGEQFLKKKEKSARDSGGTMSDDPYHDNWRTGYGIKYICKAVEGEDMYEYPLHRFLIGIIGVQQDWDSVWAVKMDMSHTHRFLIQILRRPLSFLFSVFCKQRKLLNVI